MSGLQRPSPIDLTRPNLTNVPVQLTCIPSAVDDSSDARQLCERLGTLLMNQGATLLDDLQESKIAELDDYLELRLSSRYLFKREQSSWIRLATFTIFDDEPTLDEFAVELKVELLDKHQFLLARDKLVARFKQELGFEDNAANAFSNDLYRQVTQLVFNGALRQRTFGEDRAANLHHGKKNP